LAPDPVILFTAFEPSGDALAAPLIARLKAQRPALGVYALGGPKMRDAGATLIEETTGHAKMGFGAATEARVHLNRLGKLKRWLADHPVDALIPVDSPAANWSICGAVRKRCPGAKVVHLVCPQVWAWATWRVRKLKRLTDHVLCLLPFEIDFLAEHGIPCTFVGHPVFERQSPAAPRGVADRPDAVKLALLPGSRSKEITANYPTMRAALGLLRQRGHDIQALVGASDQARARQVESMTDPADQITVLTGQTDPVIHWADTVLATSGTVTLQVLARGTPMVAMYNMNKNFCRVVRFIVKTRTFTLPNLIGESMGLGRIIPELVPHFGGPAPIADALEPLLPGGDARQEQLDAFEAVHARFGQTDFASAAAGAIVGVLGRESGD